jgi:hypothetical protein
MDRTEFDLLLRVFKLRGKDGRMKTEIMDWCTVTNMEVRTYQTQAAVGSESDSIRSTWVQIVGPIVNQQSRQPRKSRNSIFTEPVSVDKYNYHPYSLPGKAPRNEFFSHSLFCARRVRLRNESSAEIKSYLQANSISTIEDIYEEEEKEEDADEEEVEEEEEEAEKEEEENKGSNPEDYLGVVEFFLNLSLYSQQLFLGDACSRVQDNHGFFYCKVSQ